MAYEIFIEPELQELEQVENAAEWFELCSQLGLHSQLKLADKSAEKKAPPYMLVDPKTERVISVLCPRQVRVENYAASTIPLDVLKEVAKCKEHDWYSEIRICYDDKSPDPFVIGFTHHPHSWERSRHLIARWGSELLPFEELELKAVARLKNKVIESLTEMQQKIRYSLENVDAFIKDLLGGEPAPSLQIDIPGVPTF